MTDANPPPLPAAPDAGLLHRLRERGVVRVAVSYGVIAWLALQIADVVLEPLGIPPWVMTALIIAAVAGFPIALGLAWFLEIGAHGVEVDTAAPGVPRPTARGLRRYADVVVIGVLVVAVAVLAVRQSDLGQPKPPENPAIAVLPFENLSGDPEQEYFSDGLAQEVLDRLGRVPGLMVIARSSSFAYKGASQDSRTIAQQLGATTLLAGNVRRDGERLRLSAQLVDGATGREVWSGTFDRRMSDVFEVQEELAGAIIDAIVPAARGEALPREMPLTADLKAYDLYLLGRQAQEARTGWRMRDSVGYFEQAIAADPKFAKAHAALARSLALWRYFREIPQPDDLSSRAEAEAHAALAIDPDSSEAHAALGTVLRDEHPEAAAREYERALELNPNNAAALWDYSGLLSGLPNRLEEARRLMERLERLDPRSTILWVQRLDDMAARPDGGASFRREFARAFGLFEDDPDALYVIAKTARLGGFLPESYRIALKLAETDWSSPVARMTTALIPWLRVEDFDRAQRIADVIPWQDGGPLPRSLLIDLAARQGDMAEVNRLLEQLRRDFPEDQVAWRLSAYWLAVQGRDSEAAQALEKSGPLPNDKSDFDACMGSDVLSLVPLLRIYRATGRAEQADALAGRCRKAFKSDPKWWQDLAELEANEGRVDEAIVALTQTLARSPLPRMFDPRLPWYQSLQGNPEYQRVLDERQRRMADARSTMLQLEAAAGYELPLRPSSESRHR